MIKDYLDEKLHEECGVFGVYRRDAEMDVVAATYYGLYALQHRGQESCGMAVNDDGVFYKRRELGLVNEVFTRQTLGAMPRGNMCVGHHGHARAGERAAVRHPAHQGADGIGAQRQSDEFRRAARRVRAFGRDFSFHLGYRGDRLCHHARAAARRQH